ncbi:hypothetical protein AHiyo1_31390 [Arthrobacter sp. Hiyo1]|nr:hypothetical protein AHiyo1_31390 [Arthrobacter sp. Hiyo1]
MATQPADGFKPTQSTQRVDDGDAACGPGDAPEIESPLARVGLNALPLPCSHYRRGAELLFPVLTERRKRTPSRSPAMSLPRVTCGPATCPWKVIWPGRRRLTFRVSCCDRLHASRPKSVGLYTPRDLREPARLSWSQAPSRRFNNPASCRSTKFNRALTSGPRP